MTAQESSSFYPFLDVETHKFDVSRYPNYALMYKRMVFTEPFHHELLQRVVDENLLGATEQSLQRLVPIADAYSARAEECAKNRLALNVLVPDTPNTGVGRWRFKNAAMVSGAKGLSNVTLVSLKREFRASVLEAHGYVDVDAVSAHPSIFNYLVQGSSMYSQEDKDTFAHFLASKKEIYDRVLHEITDYDALEADSNVSVPTLANVKTVFTAMCYGGDPLSLLSNIRRGAVKRSVYDEATHGMLEVDVNEDPVAIRDFRDERELPKDIRKMSELITKVMRNVCVANWETRASLFSEKDVRNQIHLKWLKADPGRSGEPPAHYMLQKLRASFVSKVLCAIEHFTVSYIFLEKLATGEMYNPVSLLWMWDGVAVILKEGVSVQSFLARVNALAAGSALTFTNKPLSDANLQIVQHLHDCKSKFPQTRAEAERILAQYSKKLEKATKVSSLQSNKRSRGKATTVHLTSLPSPLKATYLEENGGGFGEDGQLTQSEVELEAILSIIDRDIPEKASIDSIRPGNRSYGVCVRHFNRYVKKVGSAFYKFYYVDAEKTIRKFEVLTTKSLKETFMNYKYCEVVLDEKRNEYDVKTLPFISTWLLDENIKPYQHVDKIAPGEEHLVANIEDTLNLWVPPAYANNPFGPDEEPLAGVPELFRELVRLATAGSESPGKTDCRDWVLNFSAWLCQKPHVKTDVWPAFCGPIRCGKSTVCLAIRKALGSPFSVSVTNPQDTILGEFNSVLAESLVVCFDDCGKGAFGPENKNGDIDDSKFKAITTNDSFQVRYMYHDPVTIRNRNQYMFCLNPGVKYPDNGRVLGFLCSSERKNDPKKPNSDNSKFWTDVYALIQHPLFGRTLYWYLMSIDIRNWNPRDYIDNSFHYKQITSNEGSQLRFLRWLYHSLKNTDLTPDSLVQKLRVSSNYLDRLERHADAGKVTDSYVDVPYYLWRAENKKDCVFFRDADAATLLEAYKKSSHNRLSDMSASSLVAFFQKLNAALLYKDEKKISKKTEYGMVFNMKAYKESVLSEDDTSAPDEESDEDCELERVTAVTTSVGSIWN